MAGARAHRPARDASTDLEQGASPTRVSTRAKIGRSVDPLDICFVPFELDMNAETLPEPERFADSVSALERLGVTWLAINLPAASRAEYKDRVGRLGELLAQTKRA